MIFIPVTKLTITNQIGFAHEMGHYISFLAAVSDQGIRFVKLYPEGPAEARFKIDRVARLYAYCNRHGLFRMKAGRIF